MYEGILERASEGRGIGRDDVETLLSITSEDDMNALFETASIVKNKYFGNKVFLYGFVYFSTYCRNNCSFCYYRRSHNTERYRKSLEEVVALSCGLRDSGVNLVDLTMGEDPMMYQNGYEHLRGIVEAVDSAVDIPIMVSPGALSKDAFPLLRDAGADWFACYQETHNRRLFGDLRIEQDYDHRRNQREWAKNNGMLTEDGIMVGIGETRADRANSIMEMGKQGCDQIRVMTFVPQQGTPLSDVSSAGPMDELKVMAVMRLAHPDRFIPASLDVEGIDGLVPRLKAGANIVTSIVPPHMDLAGVAQKELDIESGKRSVSYVIEMLEKAGYRQGSNNDYMRLMGSDRRCAT